MTAANALAGGWTAVWRLSGSNKFNAEIKDASVTATCGSTTLTGGTFTYVDDLHIRYTLPFVGNATSPATNNLDKGVPYGSSSTLTVATYAPICAAK